MRSKVIVTCVRNPFDVMGSREIREVEPGRTVREIYDEFYPGGTDYHVEVAIDGARIADAAIFDIVPQAGTSIVFCAVPSGGRDGKNPLAIIAMLAVMAAAIFVPPLIPGVVAGSIGAGLIGAGISVAGGLAVSAIFPPTVPDTPGGGTAGTYDISPTYAWEPGSNLAIEGATLPELFGTCRITPPIIGSYIEIQNDKQFLNILMAVAGHPVDSITDITINDNPVVDIVSGAELFVGLSREYRLGNVSQPVIPAFGDTRTDVSVGTLLTTNWKTQRTTGNAVQGIGVTISFPRGLYYMNDTGGIESTTVAVYMEYRKVGDSDWTPLQTATDATDYYVTTGRWSGGYMGWDDSGNYVWIELVAGSATPGDHIEGSLYLHPDWLYVDDARPFTYWHWVAGETIKTTGATAITSIQFTAAQTTPLRKTIFRDNLPAGEYDVRCALVTERNTNPRYGNEAYFDTLQEIVYDDFMYPGVSQLAIRALATDTLSGAAPRVSCIASRNHVPVWDGANYYGRDASNPAWACYHLLHQAVWDGTGSSVLAASYDVRGVPASRINYAAFQSWAAWCTEKGYTVNIYIDQVFSLRRAIDMVAVNGRGCVVQVGSKFSCIVDRTEVLPVQRFLFTVGNIVADSFQEEWLPVTDRANAIEVTFFDSALDYSRQTVTVYAQDFDTSDREINTMQATLYGCVDRTQAIKYGKFLINSNKYLTLTCSFEADVDAIACCVGDIIEVAHDVPQWGYSGRVVSSTASGVTLDRSVTIAGGTTYHVRVKHADDTFEEKTVTTGAGTYTTIAISGTWTQNPALHDLYSFGEVDRVVKLFRVLRITRSQEMRRKLTCLEYVAEVYEDGATIPEPEVISDLAKVSGLTATEVYRGGSETKVYLQWRGVALFWNVYSRRSGGAWTFVKQAYNPSCEISGLDYGILYEFSVTATDNPGDGVTVSITLRGKIDPPGSVDTLWYLKQGYAILLGWSEVTDFDMWGYELRVETVPEPYSMHVPDWDAGELLFKGNARSYLWNYQTAGMYAFHVRAVDAFGNYSINSRIRYALIGAPSVVDGSYSFSGPNVVLTWDIPASDFAIDHYGIQYGDNYDHGAAETTTKATTYTVYAEWLGVRRFWITAYDVAGNAGEHGFIDANVFPPGPVSNATARIIDNNVLLSWAAPSTGSLPIAMYAVSRGDVYETSMAIGNVQGTFTVIFEQVAGSYTYWIAGIDTAGNEGTPVGIPATVNEPPDYVLFQNWVSEFGSTKVSALVYEEALYAPINITETYTGHFAVNTSPQAQITAGYPLWIQPVPNSASYTEVFDYGILISQNVKITLDVAWESVYGTCTVTPSIEVSTDGSSWGSPVEAYSTLESGFRYVRVILTVTGAGTAAIMRFNKVAVLLDLKQKTDSGNVVVTSSGQQVDFNIEFMDITSINLTVSGTTALFAIYDFTDVPNPTHFHVYIFDAGGVDRSTVGHTISWTARGV